MEAKVAAVHAGGARVGRMRTRLREWRYAATFGGAGGFGPLVTAEVERRNGYEAPGQTLLGDGAEWIWTLGASVLAEATPVLDRWRLADARGRALRRAVPDDEERAEWTRRAEACLEKGDVPGALAVLADLARAAPEPAVGELAAFLAAQAGRIPDSSARRAAGQPVGSGGIEKGADVVVNRRFKGRRGMRWWRERAEGVPAPRPAELNGGWDRRLPRALTPPRPIYRL